MPTRLPFIAGHVIPPEHFINRKGEIRRMVSRVLNGESVAVTGEPRSGKTSLLHYLSAPALREALYGEEGARLVFHYTDSQAWESKLSRKKLLRRAFAPLVEAVRQQEANSPLLRAYRKCERDGFSVSAMEGFLPQLLRARWHVVLLIDEFDTLLLHPRLNVGEFYGGLRTLSSRFGRAFSLIIASRQPVSVLNERTRVLARTGSPLFNTLWDQPLKPFGEDAACAVLGQGGERFSEADRAFARRVAGGHPYLLQCVGAALWDAYEDGESTDGEEIGRALLRNAESGLADTWAHWSPAARKVFAIVALDQAPLLLGKREFDLEALRPLLSVYPAEKRYLQDRGLIAPDDRYPSGYRVTAEVMLWWLAETLLAMLRQVDADGGDEALGQLLAREEWLGLFKRGEREQWIKAVRALGQLAGEGVRVFIREAAAGLGRGLSGAK